MKKKSFSVRSFVLGVVSSLLVIGMVFPSAASSALKQISAYLNYQVNVLYNGEKLVLKNADGNTVVPITYEGSTYLPMRPLVEQLMGMKVDWDQATKTITIGEADKRVDLIRDYNVYYKYNAEQKKDQKATEISGYSCTHWLKIWEYYGKGKASFNVQGEYDTLTFKAYSDKDIILRVVGDNDYVLAEYSLTGGNVAQEVTVNLQGTSQITFATDYEDKNYSYNCFIFDAYLQ